MKIAPRARKKKGIKLGPFRIDFKKVLKEAEESLKDPEHRKLVDRALRHLDAEKRKMAKMTPAQRLAYNKAWAARLAKETAELTD